MNTGDQLAAKELGVWLVITCTTRGALTDHQLDGTEWKRQDQNEAKLMSIKMYRYGEFYESDNGFLIYWLGKDADGKDSFATITGIRYTCPVGYEPSYWGGFIELANASEFPE